jgi:hypothetical protein
MHSAQAMEHAGIHRPMLVSLAARHAPALSSAIHHSLAAHGRPIVMKPEDLNKECFLTVPRNDLYDINGISVSE